MILWKESMSPPRKHRSMEPATPSMGDLVGELDHSVLIRAVDIDLAQCVQGDHDHSTCQQADHGCRPAVAREQAAEKHRDRDCLQAVRRQGHKHGKGIENKVSHEGAESAHDKGSDRIQQQGRRADHDIIQVQMAARNRNSEGTEDDIHSHQNS